MSLARDAVSFARSLLWLLTPPVNACNSPRGWRCTHWPGHGGPCALTPRWWNASRIARLARHPRRYS